MTDRFGDGRDWFFEERFGLFVHWGLYAIPAWHEQIQYRKRIPRKEYEKLIYEFNPTRFVPDTWLDLAEEAGMKYVCFTTKHIDGFCLWDTAQTDYNVMHSPYGKDVLGILADACHRRNFPLCLYYSVVDMHHPNYPNQNRSYELAGPEIGDEPDLDRYMIFVKEQVRELCTQYGEIHGFWWDANVMKHRDPSINSLIRSLQPKAVINGRGFDDGDFCTPERDWDDSVNKLPAFKRPTEACQSVGTESWGYKEDENYYSDIHLIRNIDKILAKGGNYLLNVGPTADGSIPPEAVRILRTIGKWYHAVQEAFDQSEPVSHMTENPDVLLTRKNNIFYVHLFKCPASTKVMLKPIDVMPRQAKLLNTGAEVEVRVDLLPSLHPENKKYLYIRNLPVNELVNTVMVVKLKFDKFPESGFEDQGDSPFMRLQS
ncbi:MAG: alpha-L-fucosidase [Candidatus Omnitrophota bacterium]